MDRRSFYRPSFIQPVLGSLTTEPVKKEVSRRVTSPSESWPPWSSSSPITLHVCSFADGPGTDQRVCPPRPSPIRPLAGQGVFPHPRSASAERVSYEVANAIPSRRSDAHWRSH